MDGINTLVLSGAGADIIYEFSLCLELLKYVKPKKVIGTSAGAILSLAIAIGWDFKDLLEEFKQKLIGKRIYKGSLFISFFSFLKNKYFFENDLRYDIIDIILSKTNKDITFKELDFDISVVSVDYDTGNTILFNKIDTPDIKCKDAVLASSCIPGIFKPIYIEKNKINNIYYINNGTTKNIIQLVDGGFTSLYPINFIKPHEIKNTIGIYIVKEITSSKKNIFALLYQILKLNIYITGSDYILSTNWMNRTLFYKTSKSLSLLTTITEQIISEAVDTCKPIVNNFINNFNQS